MKFRPVFLASLLVLCAHALGDIPNIDSSRWSTDPRNYGMSPREYIQSDTRAFFHNFLSRSGLNTFYHFQGLTNAADRWVVSPNNDTIYSITVVNASQGFTLKLPEVGKRFISTQIITENHMTPYYIYGGGMHRFSADDFDTAFVGVGVRIGTDGSPEDVKKIVETLQPQYAIEGAASDVSLPAVDMATLVKVREALIKEYSKLPNSFDTMVKRTEDVKDWERFTYVTAGAWGLSADENAMYAIGGPENARGNTCYTATFPKVPAKAFFSITVYGPDKYLMTDKDNIVSSNRGVVTNSDGSFEVAFGGEECRTLAPNYASTTKDGWSLLLRAYKPDVAAFKAYAMPEIVPAEPLAAGRAKFASPADFGVTDYAYKVSETDFNIKRSLAKAPVNEWAHQSDVSRVKTQQVIRENQDVIYSSAVVDVSEGARISVPDGDTYHIIEIIDMQNYIVDVVYSGESVIITPNNLTYGDYVYLNMRIRRYPEENGGLQKTLKQQRAATIEAGSARPYESPDIVLDLANMEKIRAALIADVQAGKVQDTTRAQGTPFETEPQDHLYATAYGWGGLSVAHAAYLPIDKNNTKMKDGKALSSSFTFMPPAIDKERGGFWSITTYNAEGWLAEDNAAISNTEATPNPDGTYTINFNNADAPNNVNTPAPFTALLRVYVPESVEGIVSYFATNGREFLIE